MELICLDFECRLFTQAEELVREWVQFRALGAMVLSLL